MTEALPPDTGRLQLAAALLASSVIGAPLVIATAVRAILVAVDPRGGFEVETGFAYALATAGAIVAVSLVLARLKARAHDRAVLRVPFMILAVQIAFAVIVLMLLVFGPGL